MSKYRAIKSLTIFLFFVCLIHLTEFPIHSQKYPNKLASDRPVITSAMPLTSQDEDVEKVLQLIKSTPAWANVDEEDLNARKAIIEYLKKISMFNVKVIRQSIKAYVESPSISDSNYQTHFSRIFVINRYLFNVPTTFLPSNEIMRFGGWIGRPQGDCKNIWSWPLSVDASNNIQLNGTLEMYMGPAYRPLEEFDFLHSKFGLRPTIFQKDERTR